MTGVGRYILASLAADPAAIEAHALPVLEIPHRNETANSLDVKING